MDTEAFPIVGWRTWVLRIGSPILSSVAMRYDWPKDKVADATCLCNPHEAPKHTAPDANCRCGLHARTTIEGCWEEYPYYPVHGYWAYRTLPTSGLMAMGAVLMWGEIVRGKRVIRAEHGRILCLTEKPGLWDAKMGTNSPSDIVEANRKARSQTLDMVMEAYGIPMVPYATATTYCSEFGDSIKDEETK